MSKEKLKKIEQEIEEKKQKELAAIQLEAARELAMKGFSRYGIRDFFENTAVQALLLSVGVFLGIFFGIGIILFYTRSFQLMDIISAIFTEASIFGIPNFVWWIIGAAGAIVIIIFIVKTKRQKE